MTEREQTVTLADDQLVGLTSASRPVQDIAIIALTHSGRAIDESSALPNWRLELYRGDGTNLTDSAWTYQVTADRVS